MKRCGHEASKFECMVRMFQASAQDFAPGSYMQRWSGTRSLLRPMVCGSCVLAAAMSGQVIAARGGRGIHVSERALLGPVFFREKV